MRSIILGAVLLAAPAAPAAALAEGDNVVKEAQDAFGERIGLERIGLYSESQVRGFSLATAGNYRIDGAYYTPLITLPRPLIGGVITHVGWNALSADFPAPSGVVEFKLKSAPSGRSLYVETGLLDNWSPYLDVEGSAGSKDGRFGLSAGATLQRSTWSDNTTHERSIAVGVIPEWRPNAQTSVKLFFGGSHSAYPGDYGFFETTSRLPPKVDHYPGRWQASWAHWRNENVNTGAIAKTRAAGWDLQSSLIYSWFELDPADFTVLAVDDQGKGRATGIYTHNGVAYSLAGEVKAGRRFGRTRVFGMVRARRSWQRLPLADVYDLGPFDIDQVTPATPAPPATPAVRNRDIARQLTGGVGVESQITDRLRVRIGLQKSRYEKSVEPFGGGRASVIVDTPWLYDAAAIYALSKNWTVFATATRGLEESGSAPSNAANRYEALPAVLAQQYEVGFRGKLTPKVSLIGSLFEVKKPTAGFSAANVYGLNGDERHRGVELSLTGQVTPALTAVAGAVVLDAKRTGPGLLTDRPVAVASRLALLSLNYEVPKVKGLSFDGSVNHQGSELVNAVTGLTVPALTTVNLGGRFSFDVDRQPLTLRVYVSNLLDANAWSGSSSGLIWPINPRYLRMTLSTTFR